MGMWELCNLLAQRHSLNWKVNNSGQPYYQREVNGGRGSIVFQISDGKSGQSTTLREENAVNGIVALDIRATCMHLIYAAYATTLDKPWEQ